MTNVKNQISEYGNNDCAEKENLRLDNHIVDEVKDTFPKSSKYVKNPNHSIVSRDQSFNHTKPHENPKHAQEKNTKQKKRSLNFKKEREVITNKTFQDR
jgi:hypothetical protein